MNKPLGDLSLLFTNFNKGSYLDQVFEFCRKALNLGAEIVIVDDGSSDDSWERIREFKRNELQVIVSTHPNKGSAFSRNKALQLATNNYILFIDFDDQISLETLEKAMLVVRSKKAELSILNYSVLPAPGVVSMPKKTAVPSFEEIAEIRSELFSSMGYWRYIYSRDLLLRNRLLFTPTFEAAGGVFILDDLFWLLHLISLHEEVLIFPDDEVLYFYNMEPPSRVGLLRFQKQVTLFPRSVIAFGNYLEACNHIHDSSWLTKTLYATTINHLKFLKFSQLVKSLNSIRALYKSSLPSLDQFDQNVFSRDLISLVKHSLRNSVIYHFPALITLRAALK